MPSKITGINEPSFLSQAPFVLLTSNATRELSEALKRRCLFLHIDYPDLALEVAIVRRHVPDEAFDLVTSRHPVTIWWEEIARVLRPGGTYFAQHVGPASVFELIEFFLGPQPDARRGRHPDDEVAQ